MADKQVSKQPLTQPDDPIDLATSVAGEEDPGASIDLADVPVDGKPMAKPAVPPARDTGNGRA